MSTIRAYNIQHPDSTEANIELQNGGMTFNSNVLFDMPGAIGEDAVHIHMKSDHPQIRFEETDNAGAGKNYWFHQNGGNFYLLIDDNANGTWNSPHPMQVYSTGSINFGRDVDIDGDLAVGPNDQNDAMVRVESRGRAGIELHSDIDNSTGEPGGASVYLTQDAGPVDAILSTVQNAGEDGRGGAYTGTSSNSMLLGTTYSGGILHFGTNGTVRATINSVGQTTIGPTAEHLPFTVIRDAGGNSGTWSLGMGYGGIGFHDGTNYPFHIAPNGTIGIGPGSATDHGFALKVSGEISVGGLYVDDSSAAVRIVGGGASTFIAFYKDSTATRTGYLGHGSSSNDDMYISSDGGFIRCVDNLYVGTSMVLGTNRIIYNLNEIYADDGSNNDPSYTFDAEKNSGLYRNSSGIAGSGAGSAICSGGSTKMMYGSAHTTTLQPIVPNTDDEHTLGSSSLRWQIVRSAGGVSTSSDVRLKSDIEDSDLGLDWVMNLKPRKYRMKEGQRPHYGFIAQEVQQLIDETGQDFAGYDDPTISPEKSLHKEGDPGHLGLNYGEFTAPIVKAIQELTERLESLELTQESK